MSSSLFRDELHLYPTAPTVGALWLAIIAVHVALRLLWLSLTTHHKIQIKGDDENASWSWRWWPWMLWQSIRAGFQRAAVWKRVVRRSGFATLAVCVVMVGVNSTMLFLRTGSWVQQPYAWYTLQATGLRLFGESIPVPSKILDTCLAPATVAPVDATLLTMSDVLAAQSPLVKNATVVYVVPYGWDGLVEITSAQAAASNGSADQDQHRAALRQTVPHDYSRVTPVDALTMFPYVWHSMLSAGFSDKVDVVSPWARRVVDAHLTFQLVQNQEQLDSLAPGSSVFAIVQGMANALHLADALPESSKLGYIALSKEDCNNPHAESYTIHPAIRFGLFPYGDCSIVDNDRFSVIPLGPSFEHGFPTNTHLTRIPRVAERTQLLNLMVSWTVEKPTRIQAMIAALDVCGSSLATGRGCVVEHNDLAFKVLQKIDTTLGLDLRWALSSAPDAYVENLKQSVLTLCPFGKNPEQYRIWEALAAGSIPIIEDMPTGEGGEGGDSDDDDMRFSPGHFLHPSYPSTWKCRPDVDVHSFLKSKQAPVVFVTDWKRDLPRVIRYYTIDHPQELVALQTRAWQWYRAMGEHLQADLVAKSLRHFR